MYKMQFTYILNGVDSFVYSFLDVVLHYFPRCAGPNLVNVHLLTRKCTVSVHQLIFRRKLIEVGLKHNFKFRVCRNLNKTDRKL